MYILFSAKFRRTYVGQTKDKAVRLAEHNAGNVRSTKPYRPWKIMHSEICNTRDEALALEKWYKTNSGRKRISQIMEEKELKE